MSARLDIKYRPASFGDVVGHPGAVDRLKKLIANRWHAFLFAGPSGVGKTTLARIVARDMGADDSTITEIDGAIYTGIDAMRRIQEMLSYAPFGKTQERALIVDECHRLSGAAWDSLLKSIEEPPRCVTWLFCTTIQGKVPATIKSRCQLIELRTVGDGDLGVLVDRVCKSERIKLSAGERARLIVSAKGSPRTALLNLQLHVVP